MLKDETPFPFFNLPLELREEVYGYLSYDFGVLLDTHYSRQAGEDVYANYQNTSHSFFDEFERVTIKATRHSYAVSNCLHGPKTSPGDDEKSRRIFALTPQITFKAKLYGSLQRCELGEHSVKIRFGRMHRDGHEITMTHLTAVKRRAAGLTMGQYNAMCGRVLCAVREAVVEKRRIDGKYGLTVDGAESIMHALYFC